MRTSKKEDSQKRWRQSLWHLYRRNRRTLVCRLACEQALPGVRGCGREKGKIWLVSFLQLNTRGAIGGSGGGIQIYQTPVQGLKEKEREGFIKPDWCGRVLRLSILCYYKSYKTNIDRLCFFFFCFVFFVWAQTCMSRRHACVTGEE